MSGDVLSGAQFVNLCYDLALYLTFRKFAIGEFLAIIRYCITEAHVLFQFSFNKLGRNSFFKLLISTKTQYLR